MCRFLFLVTWGYLLEYWKDCGCLSFCLALCKLSIPFSIVFFAFLAQFSGPGEEKLKHAAATFCSNQPFALEMIKSRQKKDSRFQTFVQVSWVSHVRKKKCNFLSIMEQTRGILRLNFLQGLYLCLRFESHTFSLKLLEDIKMILEWWIIKNIWQDYNTWRRSPHCHGDAVGKWPVYTIKIIPSKHQNGLISSPGKSIKSSHAY